MIGAPSSSGEKTLQNCSLGQSEIVETSFQIRTLYSMRMRLPMVSWNFYAISMAISVRRDKREVTVLGEPSLQKDWLRPEEDEAWQNL